MLIRGAIHLALYRHALGGHAVEGGLVDFDCSLCSVRSVWVHCDDSHWVCGVVAELVQPRSRTVRILVEISVVEEIDHCFSNCNTELIA